MRRKNYERDDEAFPADAYTVRGHGGIAWHVLGWEQEPVSVILCPDCSFHAIERKHGGGETIDKGDKDCDHEYAHYCDEPEYERTGQVVCVMVGDDAHWTFDPSDLAPLEESAYCHECGQIGCGWGAHDE